MCLIDIFDVWLSLLSYMYKKTGQKIAQPSPL